MVNEKYKEFMMDFAFSEEQGLIRDTIQNFISRECQRDVAKKLDESRQFPSDLFQTIKEMGFCGLTIPEAYGGGGPNTLGAVLVVEELASLYPSLAAVFIASAFCGGNTISAMGSEEQKQRFLPALVQGASLFAYALREKEDAYGISPVKTIATAARDGFMLNGTKVWVRLADRADQLLALACTDPGKEHTKGLTMFVVDSKKKGIGIRAMEKVGFDSINLCQVTFKDVAVSASDILGGPEMLNQGWTQFERIIDSENLEVAGVAVGMAQGAFEYASQYAKDRVQFGKPIVDFGAVRHMLVDMAIKIRSARMLTYQAAWRNDHGEKMTIESAVARLNAVEAAGTASLNCVQVLGGYGYAQEYDAQRYLRDSLVMLTGAESVETIKERIGENLSLSSRE
ncbi:MAG: hypothetical protein EHM32_04675 [Spirochaetales bacterium]|nr:MAG: hypothetical protein EHM32_04675 [Spirochaetales bacterium]